jgi:hypothetical protein
MLKRVNGLIAGAAVIAIASFCSSACGGSEADAEEPRAPQNPSGTGERDEAWEPAMWEGLREPAAGGEPSRQRHLRPPSSGSSTSGEQQGGPKCVRGQPTPPAASPQTTTDQFRLPMDALVVCRDTPPALTPVVPYRQEDHSEVELRGPRSAPCNPAECLSDTR